MLHLNVYNWMNHRLNMKNSSSVVIFLVHIGYSLHNFEHLLKKISKCCRARWIFYRERLSPSPGDVVEFGRSAGVMGLQHRFGCVWKCCVPLNPMVLLIIIPIKWLFVWEYTLFSDKPIYSNQNNYHMIHDNYHIAITTTIITYPYNNPWWATMLGFTHGTLYLSMTYPLVN